MKKNNAQQYETIMVSLDPIKQPIAYKNRIDSIMSSSMCGDMTREEAEIEALNPIEMEFYYDLRGGLFMVQSEAVVALDITNPYTGELLDEADEEEDED